MNWFVSFLLAIFRPALGVIDYFVKARLSIGELVDRVKEEIVKKV